MRKEAVQAKWQDVARDYERTWEEVSTDRTDSEVSRNSVCFMFVGTPLSPNFR